jgi:formylglycine-generating enzyme required for sulfatase activity
MRQTVFIVVLIALQAIVTQAATTPAIPLAGDGPFIQVPAGCYQMGDTFGDGYFNEKPAHEVCLDTFAIGVFSVTRGEFARFVAATGYRTEAEQSDGCYTHTGTSWKKDPSASWRAPGFPQEDNHPAVCVSWHDATAYAEWRSRTTGKRFRLPTEAEWEYAARSGGKDELYAGGNDADSVAWHAANANMRTHAVGGKRPNGLGLHDMSGNVWQWTADWYGEFYYRGSPRHNPQGPASGTYRVYRGGSWFYDVRGARTSFRDFYVPSYRSSHLGFRLAVTPEPAK